MRQKCRDVACNVSTTPPGGLLNLREGIVWETSQVSKTCEVLFREIEKQRGYSVDGELYSIVSYVDRI
jgi:hypothetical protein